MYKIFFITLFLFTSLFSNTNTIHLSEDEKKWINNNPKIKVIEFFNEPPFTLNNNTKEGYAYELIEYLADSLNLEIEYIKGFQSYGDMLDSLDEGKVDILTTFPTSLDLGKDSNIVVSNSFLKTPFVLIGNINSKNITSIKELYGEKIAVVKGYLQDEYLSKFPQIERVYVTNNNEGFKAISEGRATYYINNRANSEYVLNKEFLTDLKIVYQMPYSHFPPLSISFALNNNNTQLVSIIEKALKSTPYQFIKNIKNKWLTYKESLDRKNLNLTLEEIEWLKKHKVIKFTADPNYLPYEAFDEDGNYIGMVSEYLDIIEKKLNIKFEKVLTKSWTESLEKAKSGEVDILSNYIDDETMKNTHISSMAYITSPISIVTKDDIKKGITLTYLKDKKIAVVKGYGYLENIFKNYPDLKYIEVENVAEGFKGVSQGKFDAMISSLTLAKYIINDLGLSNLHIAGQTSETMKLGLGVRKDWPIFIDILHKAIGTISKGFSQDIHKKWTGLNPNDIKKIKLTDNEQKWIDNHRPIKYVYDIGWAPFEWKSELNQHTGIIFDLLSLIEERSGVKFEQVSTNSWSEAIKLVKNKKAEMFSGMGENDERKEYLNFTKNNIFETPYVFVSRNKDKSDYLETFKVIQNKKVGVVAGYAIESILKNQKPDLSLLTVKTIKEGFEKVRNKDIDIFIVNAATAKYYINKLDYYDLRISTKTEFKLDLKIALQKNISKDVINIIDKAIESISEKERSDIYFKWTEVSVDTKVDWSFMYKVIGGIIILILIILYWNRNLNIAVAQKTSELKKLLNSFDENVIVSKTDKKGIITYASKAFCKISGFTKEELLGSPQNIVRHPDMPKTLFADLWSTIRSGETWSGEVKNRRKDGSFYWVEVVVEPEFDDDRKIMGYSAIRTDITDKKSVEEFSATLEEKIEKRTTELKYEKEFIQTLLDSQEQIIITTDGISLQTANETFFDFFAVDTVEEFMNQYNTQCICDTFNVNAPEGYLQINMRRETWIDYVISRSFDETHKVMITRDGHDFIFSVSAAKLPGKEGLKSAIFTDITQLENSQKESERVASELYVKVDELNRFNKITIDREIKMIELKSEINDLLKELGKEAKYKIVSLENE